MRLQQHAPAALLALVLSLALAAHASATGFLRGDSNDDAEVTIADPSYTLAFLFLGGPPPVCPDAADSDDSGVLEITDPVHTLEFLFRGGPRPPAPGTIDCGVDPTADFLPICRSTACEAPFDFTAELIALPETDVPQAMSDFAAGLVQDALHTILNSPGDAVTIHLQGEVSYAVVPGVPITVAVDREIDFSAIEDGAFELAISMTTAAGIGVELYEGLEAGIMEGRTSRCIFRFDDFEQTMLGLHRLITRFVVLPAAEIATETLERAAALAQDVADAADELALAEELRREKQRILEEARTLVSALERELQSKRDALDDALAELSEFARLIEQGCDLVPIPNPLCGAWRTSLTAARRAVNDLNAAIDDLTARLSAARAAERAAELALDGAIAALQAAEKSLAAAQSAFAAIAEAAARAEEIIREVGEGKVELQAAVAAYELVKPIEASIEVFVGPFPGVEVNGLGLGAALTAEVAASARVEFDDFSGGIGLNPFKSLALELRRAVALEGSAELLAGFSGSVELSSAVRFAFDFDSEASEFLPNVGGELVVGIDASVVASAGVILAFEVGAGREMELAIDLVEVGESVLEGVWGLVSDGDLGGLALALLSFEAELSSQDRLIVAGVAGLSASYVGYGAGIEGSCTWSDRAEPFEETIPVNEFMHCAVTQTELFGLLELLVDEVAARTE